MFLMLKLAGSEVRFVTLKATLPDKYSLFAGLATVRLSCAKANVEKSAVKKSIGISNLVIPPRLIYLHPIFFIRIMENPSSFYDRLFIKLSLAFSSFPLFYAL